MTLNPHPGWKIHFAQAAITVILAFAFVGCATPRWTAARQGRDDARKELESGVMAMEICGNGFGPAPASEKFLADQGVEIRLVGGCMPSDETIGHAEGFNEVMTEAMKKKLGADVLIRAENSNGTKKPVGPGHTRRSS